MLDTRDAMGADVEFTFIEPYPARLHELLRDSDASSVTLITKNLQEIGLERFTALRSGDILFVDSSHILKTHSDVNYILFEILPALRTGVLVHFHDIIYPFEYPKEWVLRGRVYNEAYAVRAFLQYNARFRIVLWNSYLRQFHGEWLAANMPLCLKGNQSLWLERE
jgi:hypothetical protein